MQKILIIGATSAIAEAVARRYAQRASALHLVARDVQRVQAIASDLSTRGASRVTIGILDVADLTAHRAILDEAVASLGNIDVVLLAHGTLPLQAACDEDLGRALAEFHVNGTATIALAAGLAPHLGPESTLAVISSVAGDRGRASNFLYGSAKSAVTAYMSGLGQQLRAARINVLVIKPGFVDTPMTAAFKKGPLWASADKVAAGIVRAIDRRRAVAYVPGFWWFIMQVIKNIPEPIFRRIKL